MFNLLTRPQFADEDKTLIAHHLFIIIWTFMAVGWLPVFIAVIIPETVYRWLLVIVVIETAGVVLLFLNSRGHTRLVSRLVIFMIWIVATGMALTGGGTSSNAMAIYLIIVLIAGLVQSGKAGMLTAGLCSLTGLFLVFIEYNGLLPVNQVPHTPLTQWIANTIYMIIIIGLQYLVSRTIKNALQQSREELKERQRADAALRESEERFRSIADYTYDWESWMGPDGKLIWVNPGVERVTGYSVAECFAMPDYPLPIIDAQDSGRLASEFARAVAGETGSDFEFRIRSKDGTLRWGAVSFQPIYDASANNIGHRSSIRDITKRKQIEHDLQERQRTLSTLISNLPGFVYRCANDREWTMEYMSDGCREVTGYGPDDFIANKTLPYNDIVHPDFRDILWEKWQGLLKTKKPFIEEYPIVTKNGEIRWVWERGIGVYGPDGELLFLEGFITDVTSRRRSEEALQKSMERLRKAVGSTIDVIIMAVETRDPYTAGHQQRVADLARAIATEMALPAEQIDGIRMAATIHDLGKISIPAEILSMPRRLTSIEWELVKNHAQAGYEILKDVDFDWPVADIVLQHHERLDGSGYPQGLKGSSICLEARIVAVADVVEAIATHRPYRPAFSIEDAFEEIGRNRGLLYDPAVVDVCISLFVNKGYRFPSS